MAHMADANLSTHQNVGSSWSARPDEPKPREWMGMGEDGVFSARTTQGPRPGQYEGERREEGGRRARYEYAGEAGM